MQHDARVLWNLRIGGYWVVFTRSTGNGFLRHFSLRVAIYILARIAFLVLGSNNSSSWNFRMNVAYSGSSCLIWVLCAELNQPHVELAMHQ